MSADRFELYCGDSLEVLCGMGDCGIDAVVTDPPYGWNFMGKGWDRGIPPIPYWAELLRVSKPGAHLLAFGGTRTYHRLICAIEDAGWEIRDCVMWVYGSGFPKSHDVSKAIDKEMGAEREDAIQGGHMGAAGRAHGLDTINEAARDIENTIPATINKGALTRGTPVTSAAVQWSGWGTSLKPAWESIIVARKRVTPDGELRIIVENLNKLEAQLCLLYASIAGKSFELSQDECAGVVRIAQWSVGDAARTLAGLSGLTGMLPLESAIGLSLSIVSSWRGCWEEALRFGSMFTIETATSKIIDLPILRSSLLAITPDSITRAVISLGGQWFVACSAARIFNAASEKLRGTLEHFAVESAIEGGALPATTDFSVSSKPIILARKPLEGTVAQNVMKWGVGGINVDGCRVGHDEPSRKTERNNKMWLGRIENTSDIASAHPSGRWPANLIHDGSWDVLGLFPETGAKGRASGYDFTKGNNDNPSHVATNIKSGVHFGDSGSAARFFYCAKASKADRDEGCEGLPKYPIYTEDAMQPKRDVRPPEFRANHHPTVKPTALMRYLCRLVTPPNGVILDPFMGSGSTGKAAMLEGFRFIGIDKESEYVEIARRRIGSVSSR